MYARDSPHLRAWEPVRRNVIHDGRLRLERPSGPATTEDGAVSEIEDVAVAPGSDQLHPRVSARSRESS